MKAIIMSTLISVCGLQAHAAFNGCDTTNLADGSYVYLEARNQLEQPFVRAEVQFQRIADSNEFNMRVAGADRYSGLQNGTYKLVLSISNDDSYQCNLSLFDSAGRAIVPLAGTGALMSSKYSSHANIVGQSVYMTTKGFGGCGGEGGSGVCAPVKGQLEPL